MSTHFKLLMLPFIFSTFIHAVDIEGVNEIISNATEATESIAIEIEEAIETPTTEIEPSVVAEEQPLKVKEETTSTIINIENNITKETSTQTVTTPETNQTIPIAQEEDNSSVASPKEPIASTPEVSTEKGNPVKGKNIYKYVLKEDCNMTGYKFAEKFSQEEWEEVIESNTFKETIFESCPNVKSYYQERWTDDLYQFFYEASDEDEIPEC